MENCIFFQLNICDWSESCGTSASTGEKVAVCDQNKKNLGEIKNTELRFSDSGQLTLTYTGQRDEGIDIQISK